MESNTNGGQAEALGGERLVISTTTRKRPPEVTTNATKKKDEPFKGEVKQTLASAEFCREVCEEQKC